MRADEDMRRFVREDCLDFKVWFGRVGNGMLLRCLSMPDQTCDVYVM